MKFFTKTTTGIVGGAIFFFVLPLLDVTANLGGIYRDIIEPFSLEGKVLQVEKTIKDVLRPNREQLESAIYQELQDIIHKNSKRNYMFHTGVGVLSGVSSFHSVQVRDFLKYDRVQKYWLVKVLIIGTAEYKSQDMRLNSDKNMVIHNKHFRQVAVFKLFQNHYKDWWAKMENKADFIKAMEKL